MSREAGGDPVAIRLERATRQDIPAVVALMNSAFRGVGPQASWNTEAEHIDGDRTSQALLREELAAKPDAFLLVARSDAALIASVWVAPLDQGRWCLGSLAVDPVRQDAGLGRAMLYAAEAWIGEQGGRTIRMTVVNVRDTLIAWYVRRGYHLTGEVSPFPYEDARFGVPKRPDLAFVTLEKSLSPPMPPQQER